MLLPDWEVCYRDHSFKQIRLLHYVQLTLSLADQQQKVADFDSAFE